MSNILSALVKEAVRQAGVEETVNKILKAIKPKAPPRKVVKAKAATKAVHAKKCSQPIKCAAVASTEAISRPWEEASVEEAVQLYLSGRHKELTRLLPHLRDKEDVFIQRLLKSRLLKMWANQEQFSDDKPVTLGYDPEFILNDKQGDIVLFSSKLAGEGGFLMSEASVGADYGLLEFRCTPRETVSAVIEELNKHTEMFSETYTEISILEKEAVIFDHKLERIRQQLYTEEDIDFGVTMHKYFAADSSVDIDDMTSFAKLTLSAFDQVIFNPTRSDLLSAGGHLHIGGTFVRMLSLDQLKEYIRRVDMEVRPIVEAVETDAAKLRRELYGFPGEFRIKPYGVEYRTPSNAIFWPKNVKVLEQVYNIMIDKAKTFFTTDDVKYEEKEVDGRMIPVVKQANSGDLPVATKGLHH